MMRVVAVVFACIATAVPVHAGRYALLVGSSQGAPTDASLKYVGNDLTRVRTVLVELCGFGAGDVCVVDNADARTVLDSMARVKSRITNGTGDDLFLFYYTGHADAGALRLGDDRLQIGALADSIGAFPARIRLAMLDACQSGAFTRLKGGSLAEPFLLASDTKVEGLVMLSSSSASENAQESDALRSSVFTFHFVNALRGSADESRDGRVTLSEAYQYAYHRTVSSTVSSTGGVQHPSYRFELKGEGDIVLADLNVYAGGLAFAPDIDGALTVVDSIRTVVADVVKQRGSALMVAVGPGTYEVVRRSDGATERAVVRVGRGPAVAVQRSQFVRAPSVAGERRKGKGPRDFSLELSGGAGYRYASIDEANEGLARMYSALADMEQSAVPELSPSMVTLWVGAETCLWSRLVLSLDFAGSKSTGSGKGGDAWLNPVDSIVYGREHRWDSELTAIGVRAGVACRILRGNAGDIDAGVFVDCFDLTGRVSWEYRDELYGLRQSGEIYEGGLTAIAGLSLSYHRALWRRVTLGVVARWRYKSGAKTIGDDGTSWEYAGMSSVDESLKFDLSGFDAGVRLGVELARWKR